MQHPSDSSGAPSRPPGGARWTTLVLGIAALALIGVAFVLWLLVGTRDPAPALARFFSVPPSSVIRIVIRPATPPYTSPVAAPMTITNPQAIARMLQSFRPATEVHLNHPATLTRYEIEIVTASGSSYGTTDATANQGVILMIWSRPSSGWFYGAYQNDQLSTLIQSATGGTAQLEEPNALHHRIEQP